MVEIFRDGTFLRFAFQCLLGVDGGVFEQRDAKTFCRSADAVFSRQVTQDTEKVNIEKNLPLRHAFQAIGRGKEIFVSVIGIAAKSRTPVTLVLCRLIVLLRKHCFAKCQEVMIGTRLAAEEVQQILFRVASIGGKAKCAATLAGVQSGRVARMWAQMVARGTVMVRQSGGR